MHTGQILSRQELVLRRLLRLVLLALQLATIDGAWRLLSELRLFEVSRALQGRMIGSEVFSHHYVDAVG